MTNNTIYAVILLIIVVKLKLRQNVPLERYSTMRLGGMASFMTKVRSETELIEAYRWAKAHNLPAMVIGGGSNIIWQDTGFKGLLIINKLSGYQFKEINDNEVELTIAAGENWDKIVQKSVQKNLSGIEFLSLIPGTAGATPVQNVGAYGSEIKDVLVSLKAYDSTSGDIVNMGPGDCNFGYRTSRFKTSDHGRYAIISLTLKLTKQPTSGPLYGALQQYLNNKQVKSHSPRTIRRAVIAIRRSKLPDPKHVANCGSFFANPIVDSSFAKQLLAKYPKAPHWPLENNKTKLAAAWMIDQAGYKKHYDATSGMATWPAQPLVLVNKHARSANDLINYRDQIITKVKDQFGVTLVQEPEILP